MPENEVVEAEIVEDNDDSMLGALEDAPREAIISVTGYNTHAVVTPVQCNMCETEYYIKPDTIAEDENSFCPACGIEFDWYDEEI